MLFRKPTSIPLADVIARYLPVADAAGCFSALEGLSGTSFCLKTERGRFNARKIPEQRLPGLSLHRYHKVLKQLPAGMAPQPYKLVEGWLLSHWLEGEPWSGPLPTFELARLLHRLHRQPLFGWRVRIAPLLSYYWQQSSPTRRTAYWLGLLKHLLATKEPRPLRLAPLHMDVHAGNIIRQTQGLGLIDWEYAGDGDIGLELSTILACNTFANDDFLSHYAHLAHLDPYELHRQITRWQPWVKLLVASWYECRWQQTNQPQFATLADQAWQEMRYQEKIWVR
ncbi:thiamine kinase [Klebsiella sp. BIGb0407]|uniref:thiamine kinase n=1 Tax=Klebsiella sp. BIGb0407 TaxID=2940603 RepID=UPI00216A45EA|nr:thiamine kinase [Klebsiella sp. BIGb0407]MCS3433622.1 thiamine kinase [Klebsiella sp. BIGb0407]